MIALDGATVDPVLESYVTGARRDPATFGVLLHGSRASGRHRDDSDYDLIRIVARRRMTCVVTPGSSTSGFAWRADWSATCSSRRRPGRAGCLKHDPFETAYVRFPVSTPFHIARAPRRVHLTRFARSACPARSSARREQSRRPRS